MSTLDDLFNSPAPEAENPIPHKTKAKPGPKRVNPLREAAIKAQGGPARLLKSAPTGAKPGIGSVPNTPGPGKPGIGSVPNTPGPKRDGPQGARLVPHTDLQPYTPKAIVRHPNGKFGPGTGGGGRKASLVAYGLYLTADGVELLEHAVTVMRGWVTWQDPDTGEVIKERVSIKDQAVAREYLSDRGLAPRVHQVQMEVHKSEGPTSSVDLTKLSTDETRTYLQLLRKAQGAERVIEGERIPDNQSVASADKAELKP